MARIKECLARTHGVKTIAKALKSVQIRFNPFDPDAKTSKRFLRRVCLAREEKPELGVKVQILEKQEPPSIELEYADDKRQVLYPVGVSVEWVEDVVQRKARFMRFPNPIEKLKF